LYMRMTLMNNFKIIEENSLNMQQRNKKITELNNRLEALTLTDPLTGIHNRRHFDMKFEDEWKRAARKNKPLNVFMIDIDYFKKYNDSYGHLEGDICLKEVAEILESCFNRSSEFVARFGGEEFVAITDGEHDDCVKLSDLVHKKIEQASINHNESEFNRLTLSIGVACIKADKDVRPHTLMERADIALYAAKNKGRNQTIFYDISLLA